MMAGRPLQFDGQSGLNGLHNSLIEPMKVVCEDSDCTFLLLIHLGCKFFGPFFHAGSGHFGLLGALYDVGVSSVTGLAHSAAIAWNWALSVDSPMAVVDDLPDEIVVATISN